MCAQALVSEGLANHQSDACRTQHRWPMQPCEQLVATGREVQRLAHIFLRADLFQLSETILHACSRKFVQLNALEYQYG